MQTPLVPSDVIITEEGDEQIEKSTWSDKMTAGINVGSQWISWGLLKGAEYTSVLVAKVLEEI